MVKPARAPSNPLLFSTATGRDWNRATEADKDDYCTEQAQRMQEFLPGVKADFFKRNLNEVFDGVSDSILSTPLSRMMGLIVAAQSAQWRR